MHYRLQIKGYIWFDNVIYTTLTNFSMKYLVMCKVYTDVGGMKYLYHVCPPVGKIIHSLRLVWIILESTYRRTTHGITIT